MFALTGETYRVEGVILSGGRRYLGWISKFTLYFSMDKENWELAPTDKVVRICDQPIISEEGPVNLNTSLCNIRFIVHLQFQPMSEFGALV